MTFSLVPGTVFLPLKMNSTLGFLGDSMEQGLLWGVVRALLEPLQGPTFPTVLTDSSVGKWLLLVLYLTNGRIAFG